MAAFLGVAVGQRAPGEVDRVHPAAHGVHAAQQLASGTATNRASTTPPATSGSNGVYSM